MNMDTGDTKFDLRTRERTLREGNLTKQDLDNYLKKLPDESGQAESIPVYEETPAQESHASKNKEETSEEPTFSAATEV